MKFKDHIKNMFTVYCREFKLVRHDVGIILFFMFLPLVYPLVYSLIYNPELVKDVAMVVVDHDRTPLSRELVRKMDATDQSHVIGYASDLNEARHAVNSHQAYAILEIPEGFARKVGRNETGNAVMYCEMSLLLRYRGFLVASTNVMQDFSSELMTQSIDNIAPLAETVVNGDLMPVKSISMGNIRNGFDSFIMPGVLILILQQCIVLAVGMAGGAQREKMRYTGYCSDNLAPSIPLTMIAQMLCYLTVLLIPIIFMLHYVPLIFRFPMEGSNLEIFAFITPMILASFGMGFTFQSIVTEREAVFVLWVATSLLFLLLSGLIWPLYDMYPAWRWLASICPATWGVEGFVKMNANGASLSQIADPYRNLWILAVVWGVLGYCARRFVVRPELKRLYSNYHKA
ncbi:MAG: ABC transporter permease [Muribaculaceae bacterium]|nr:ABC transporter permease [Muribaculaceae bacterium]